MAAAMIHDGDDDLAYLLYVMMPRYIYDDF
jgi:hypothetical protein